MAKYQMIVSAEAVVTSILSVEAETEEEAKKKMLEITNNQETMPKIPWELTATIIGSAQIEECILAQPANEASKIWLPGDPAPVVIK